MIISFHGGNTVKFQTGDMVIVSNPSQPPHGQKSQRIGASMVLCSSFAPEHHALGSVTQGDSEPFIIDGPGSYEYHGYTVHGEQLGRESNDTQQSATLYSFTMDDIRVCILGSIVARDELSTETSELFADTDILVLPIDGERLADTHSLMSFIDPHIIVPVGFWNTTDAGLTGFLKEHGIKSDSGEDKITIKRKDVEPLSKSIRLLSL